MTCPPIHSLKRKQLTASVLALLVTSQLTYADEEKSFNRISTFPVFLNSSIENETVAEIVTASKDGKTLIYTDGKMGAIGFVNIKNVKNLNRLAL